MEVAPATQVGSLGQETSPANSAITTRQGDTGTETTRRSESPTIVYYLLRDSPYRNSTIAVLSNTHSFYYSERVQMYLHVALALSHERQHFVPISQRGHWHHILVVQADPSAPCGSKRLSHRHIHRETRMNDRKLWGWKKS